MSEGGLRLTWKDTFQARERFLQSSLSLGLLLIHTCLKKLVECILQPLVDLGLFLSDSKSLLLSSVELILDRLSVG